MNRVSLAIAGVILAAMPVAAQQGFPALTATRDVVIDAAQNHLTRIGWLGMARDGALIVTQPVDHAIKYFSASGALIGSMGKEGEGTGEFATMTGGGWLGDSLWVTDGQLKRLTLISPQRKALRTVSTTIDVLFPDGQPVPTMTFTVVGSGNSTPITPALQVTGAYPDGGFLVSLLLGGGATVPAEWHKPARSGPAYVRIASNGVIKSLVAWGPVAQPCTNFALFCPSVRNATAPDGSAIAFAVGATAGPDSGTIAVTVVHVGGDTAYARKYPFAGIPVPQAYADSVMDALRKQRQALPSGVTPPPLPAFQPTVFPPVSLLMVSRDGSVWIGGPTTDGKRNWLVLNDKGNVRGTFSLGADVTIRSGDATGFWATERTDVRTIENVVRYRLTP